MTAEQVQLEAHQVHPGLWVGSRPPAGSAVRCAGFNSLVLCAAEYQPHASEFHPGLCVVHAPLHDEVDHPMPEAEWSVATGTAAALAGAMARHHRVVLVTCSQGRNRSALVAALTMHFLTGASGLECARVVRERRRSPWGEVLANPRFIARLATVDARPARSPA